MGWTRSRAVLAATFAAVLACGSQVDAPSGSEEPGDIRGVEELGSPAALTALSSGDATFLAASGKLTVALLSTEPLVIVSRRASDSAILLNGQPVIDTLKTTFATASNLKWLVVTAAANSSTVVLDYYNGTFAPGIAPVSPALFGASAGTQVNFGSTTSGSFKVRGSSSATVGDTLYAGSDASNGVLISFSGTNPDIYVTGTNTPALGFSLGNGNDTFDATNAKGKTHATLTQAVTVHGGLGNDTILGGAGADTLYGDEDVNVIDESTTPSAHVADTVYGLTTPAASGHTYNWTTVTYANWDAGTGVTAEIAHIGGAAIGDGLVPTDHIDDSVGVIIGSPVADTLECSQSTDKPCILQGGAGDDTLSPGASVANTHYLYGGDGNDTFKMGVIGTNVWVAGGNLADVTVGDAGPKNLYIDTVDYYTGNGSVTSSSISMNAAGPSACNPVDGGVLPCPGTADSTLSGPAGSAHASIRNDVTVARCPAGSASAVCTVKANNSGNIIWSGEGPDLLTGGTGDDVFVLRAPPITTVFGTGGKVIIGGGGNDTADFSQRTTGVVIQLNCSADSCDNSGNPHSVAPTAAGAHAAADAKGVTITSDVATITGWQLDATEFADNITSAILQMQSDYSALGSPSAADTASIGYVNALQLSTQSAVSNLQALFAISTAAANRAALTVAAGDAQYTSPTDANTAVLTGTASVTGSIAYATTEANGVAGQELATDDAWALALNDFANFAYNPATSLTLSSDRNALVDGWTGLYSIVINDVEPASLTLSQDISGSGGLGPELTIQTTMTVEQISLVNINNAVCPLSSNAGGPFACAVTTNDNADEVDFSGDGAEAGSALTCNSSNVITYNASGLAANCGL